MHPPKAKKSHFENPTEGFNKEDYIWDGYVMLKEHQNANYFFNSSGQFYHDLQFLNDHFIKYLNLNQDIFLKQHTSKAIYVENHAFGWKFKSLFVYE